MQKLPVKPINDQSEMAEFSIYEEQLNLRNVHLEEYENRLKQFVFKVKPTERISQPSDESLIKLK